MLRRWGLAVLMLGLGVVLVLSVVRSAPVLAAVEGAVMLLIAGLVSPALFPRSVTVAEAHRRSAADGAPVVFWRPGCRFCLGLRLRLGTAAGRLHWVDIWRDAEAAAELRWLTGGDETVPTVLVDGHAHVNPEPGWVRDRVCGGLSRA